MIKTLNRVLEALLYPIYAPSIAVMMLYFTATPYANLPTQERLFILGTVVLYTILIPKPLVRLVEVRYKVRMTRWRTHAIYIISHILCYTTLMGIRGVEPILQVLMATIICEAALPLFRKQSSNCSMTLGLLLSFIILMNYVGSYQGDLFSLLIATIILTGYLCTVEFGKPYNKRRQVLSSLLFGTAALSISLLLRV